MIIGDQNPIELNDDKVTLVTGDNYLDNLDDYDLIIKTPGMLEPLKGVLFPGVYINFINELILFLYPSINLDSLSIK